MKHSHMLGSYGLILGLMLALAPALLADDWPQFNGPKRNNQSAETGILARSWPESGPKELWSTTVGVGFGGPAVVGDEVYLLDREEDERDVLRCLSLKTGKETWRVQWDVPGRISYNGSRAVPTVTKTQIFAVGPFGHMYCVDRKTHKTTWRRSLVDDFGSRVPRFGFSQSPLVVGDLVIVGAAGSKGSVVALKTATGKVAWAAPAVRRGGTYESPVLRTLCGVEQVTAQVGGTLMGLKPDTGSVLWKYTEWSNRNPIPHATQVGKDKLFLTAGYGAGSRMVKIAKSGDAWSTSTEFVIEQEGSQIHPALLHGDHLYANFNRNRNLRRSESFGMACIDMKGNVLWKTAGTPAFNRGNLIMVDGLIIALGGEDGVLRLIEPSPKKYKEISSIKVFKAARRQNQIWAPMAFVGGKLVLRDQGTIKCLDISKEGVAAAAKAAGSKPKTDKGGSSKKKKRIF